MAATFFKGPNMLQRRWLVLAAAFVVSLGVDAALARQFQSSDVESLDHPAVKAVSHMAELIHQRSDGRLAIGDLGAGNHYSEIFTVAQLRTGGQDMARVSMAALHGVVPSSVVATLPFLFASKAQRRRSLDGPVGDELLAAFADYDLIGLCFYDVGPRSIYTASKPIRTPADLKGLKIRVQASPTMAEIMQALGASPVATPYVQIRARFVAGTIDAAENNVVSYLESRQYEVARIYSLTEHAAPPAVVVFSKRVWDQLSAVDRQIIRQAARDSVPYFRKLSDEQEAAAQSALTGAGVQFVTDVDRPAFVKALAPLQSRLVPDPRHRTLVEKIRSSAD